jgi:hypothetical protein
MDCQLVRLIDDSSRLMRLSPFPFLLRAFIVSILALAGPTVLEAAVKPEVAELNFNADIIRPGVLAEKKVPAWVTKVEQQGGRFETEPPSWTVAAAEPQGAGRLVVTLDRKAMNEDLVAMILFDAADSADLVMQLFDGLGRSVEVDLFGNLQEVSKEAATDTFVIPLRKHPTAEKIVLRRVTGDVKIYGLLLYPVVTEGEPNVEALRKLAAALNDPLSPENPLLKSLQQMAQQSKVSLEKPAANAGKSGAAANAAAPVSHYAGAVPPPKGAPAKPIPLDGLVGYWNFEGDGNDRSGLGHHGRLRGAPTFAPGNHGQALRLRKNPSMARRVSWDSMTLPAINDLQLKDTGSVAAWIKYSSIAPTWGSQIFWFGDQEYGRDPWTLSLFPGGTLAFRSDRSVTGQPKFTVFEDEIALSPAGRPMLTQHVNAYSPQTLAPETWYFVAATLEKVSPRNRALKLYVNGEVVAETVTDETVSYPTDKFWMTIGAVDTGEWQNFDGLIDEVRLYRRALSATEVRNLYAQPWQ